MSNSDQNRGFPGTRFLLIFGCLAVVVLLAAFVWQNSVQNAKEDDAESHREVATLIQSAQADGAASGELLQQYVATGDETLLPQMQAKTDSGVTTLTQALSQAGSDPNNFVQQGSQIVQSAGQVIALRQSGDIQGASNALTALAEEFTAFLVAQDEFVVAQQDLAVADQDSAESAESLAAWFAIAAAAIGFAVVIGSCLIVTRRLMRRNTVGALSS